MYCPRCGKEFAPSANFCSACGAAAIPQQPILNASRIVRPLYPRMIAGVCSGFAIHFGWDLSVVRIVLVVFTILTSGIGLLCYLAAWIILPEAAYSLPAEAGFPPPYTGAYTTQNPTQPTQETSI
jgi:phage shock protein C